MLNQTNYFLLSIAMLLGAMIGNVYEQVFLGLFAGAAVFAVVFFIRRASRLKKGSKE